LSCMITLAWTSGKRVRRRPPDAVATDAQPFGTDRRQHASELHPDTGRCVATDDVVKRAETGSDGRLLVRQVSHVEIDHQVLSRQGIASAQVEVEILRDPVVDDVLVDVVITGGKIAYAGIEREPVAAEADIAHGAPARQDRKSVV